MIFYGKSLKSVLCIDDPRRWNLQNFVSTLLKKALLFLTKPNYLVDDKIIELAILVIVVLLVANNLKITTRQ